ncbi:MAG: hypothetical protein KAR83_07100 [Thermodesulfovibrionales bacterium]|nr:hypothetical protein [Thermodesulfovibrionales bacterium]
MYCNYIMGSPDNHLKWLAEPLEDEPSLIRKPMFGALAYYLRGRLVLVLSDRQPPWKGLLLPTEFEFQLSLRGDFPALAPHPILGKWLYLPVTTEDFESIAADIVQAISEGDPRIGVEPKPRKKRRKAPKK